MFVVPVTKLVVAEAATLGWLFHVTPVSVQDAVTRWTSCVLLAAGASKRKSLRLAEVIRELAGIEHGERLNLMEAYPHHAP